MEGADIIATTNYITTATITVNHNLTDSTHQPIANEQEQQHIVNDDISVDTTPNNNSPDISLKDNNKDDNFHNMDTQEPTEQIADENNNTTTYSNNNINEYESTDTQLHEAQRSEANNSKQEYNQKQRI